MNPISAICIECLNGYAEICKCGCGGEVRLLAHPITLWHFKQMSEDQREALKLAGVKA